MSIEPPPVPAPGPPPRHSVICPVCRIVVLPSDEPLDGQTKQDALVAHACSLLAAEPLSRGASTVLRPLDEVSISGFGVEPMPPPR